MTPRKRHPTKERVDNLYRRFVREMDTGLLAVNQRLPSLGEWGQKDNPELQEPHYIARRAYARLREAGRIETRGRAGTFVAEKPSSQKGNPKLIALITPAPSHFVSQVIRGIQRRLDEASNSPDGSQRYRLICANSEGKVDRELQIVTELKEEVDGLMLLPSPPGNDEKNIERVTELSSIWQTGKPIVLVGAGIDSGSQSFRQDPIVYPEDAVARRIFDFVKDLPKPQHVYIVGEDHNSALRERAGLIGFHFKKEFPVTHVHLFPSTKMETSEVDLTPQELGQHYVRQMVEEEQIPRPGQPILIICTTDLVAFGVLYELRCQAPQIRVPGQVMVIGVDGEPGGMYSNPTLASLELSPDMLGEKAAEAVLVKLENRTGSPALELKDAVGSVRDGESAPKKPAIQ
jgi:DNA-binding LacI/PurR family transcriptional regulator